MANIDSDSKIKSLPVIPIRDGVVFPNTEIVLTFGRPRSLQAIEASSGTDRNVVLVMQKTPHLHEPNPTDLFKIGTIARIERLLKTDGEINALVKGLTRVEILNYTSSDPYFVAKVIEVPDETPGSDEITALINHITTELKKAVNLGKSVDFLSFMNIMSGLTPSEFSNHVAAVLDIKTQEKFDKSVKEAVLRERLKTIEKELGQEGESKEVREMLDKIKKASMPLEVEEKAKKELKRLAQMSSYNPEASYIRTYLDWLVELPWGLASPNDVDIKSAAKILDDDHYGLKKVKERILEYLAVMKLKKDTGKADLTKESKMPIEQASSPEPAKRRGVTPTILCFVGPPGVGKTSLGRSIARALGRKFVKISLVGIRDEAEIRGH